MAWARGEPDAGRLACPVRRCGSGKRTVRKSGAAPRPDPYIFSRYVPGWMLAHAENARLAEALLADTVAKQGIGRHQLTVHADRGSSMASKPVAFLLADLGVTKSHSRPHVSNVRPGHAVRARTGRRHAHRGAVRSAGGPGAVAAAGPVGCKKSDTRCDLAICVGPWLASRAKLNVFGNHGQRFERVQYGRPRWYEAQLKGMAGF